MANYPSPIKFEQTSTSGTSVRSIISEFGDGYQEVTPDGINYLTRSGTIVHTLVPQSDTSTSVGAGSLRTFLRSVAGTNTVVTIPNYFEDPTGNTSLDVYIESWSESYRGTTFTFSINFRESFNG